MSPSRLRRMKEPRGQLAEEEEEELEKAQVSMERVLVGWSSSRQKEKKNRLERRRKDGQGRRDEGASRHTVPRLGGIWYFELDASANC